MLSLFRKPAHEVVSARFLVSDGLVLKGPYPMSVRIENVRFPQVAIRRRTSDFNKSRSSGCRVDPKDYVLWLMMVVKDLLRQGAYSGDGPKKDNLPILLS